MIATAFRYHHYECFAPRSTQLKINDEPDNTLGQKCLFFGCCPSLNVAKLMFLHLKICKN